MQENTGHNVGPNLVDKCFENTLSYEKTLILHLKLSYKKTNILLKKKEKTTFPFDLNSDLYLENNSDYIVKESTRQNVGSILVDNSFEKDLSEEETLNLVLKYHTKKPMFH